MPLSKSEYLSDTWRDGLFGKRSESACIFLVVPSGVTAMAMHADPPNPANKVVFCTGGAGTICSAQVRGLVHLGADACIVGRNVEKTEAAARDIATARPGAKVIGVGAVDVRKIESLQSAVDRCVKELGAIDFVM